MKRIIITLIIGFLLVANYNLLYGQFHENLGNNTGLDLQSIEGTLDTVAGKFINSFPEIFNDSIIVYTYSFYLHSDNFESNISSELDRIIDVANSDQQHKYYTLIAYQVDERGDSKIFISINLPNRWLDNCYSDLYIQVFKTKIEQKFFDLSKKYTTQSQFVNLYKEGFQEFTDEITKLTDCCTETTNLLPPECNNCISAYDILDELNRLGFEPYYAGYVTNSSTTDDQLCLCLPSEMSIAPKNGSQIRNPTGVVDLANLIITIESIPYNLGDGVSEFVSSNSELNYTALITKNKTICNHYGFEEFEANYSLEGNKIWIHIWENPLVDDEDIVFIKFKTPPQNSEKPELDELNIQADPPPPYAFKIVHRSFAPWNWFGHLPFSKASRNSFMGDNRGFSLAEPVQFKTQNGVTARINQQTKFVLGEGETKLENGLDPLFSSLTRGYRNFRRKIPIRMVTNPYKQELDHWEYGPAPISEAIEEPEGFSNILVDKNNNITTSAMFFEGSDPLVDFATDIEWYLELGIYYTQATKQMHISGKVVGKEFPAYEAFLEDKCGNKVFLYTFTSPCESKLFVELFPFLHDFNDDFEYKIQLDDNGCFTGQFWNLTNNSQLSIEDWNQFNLDKEPAEDCPSNPCQGSYTDDGTDLTIFFNCND